MNTKMSHNEAGKLGRLKSAPLLKIRYDKFKEDYYLNPKKCLQCGKDLNYDKRYNKFCSQSCGAIFNNHKRGYNNKQSSLEKINTEIVLLERYCLNCGKLLTAKYTIYCCTECHKEHQFKNKMNNITEKGEFPYNPKDNETNRRVVRQYLIEKFGDKCSICGTETWNGQPLIKIVDHIDGDSHNHKIENFRLVCSNCDSQLPTYKAKNKKGTRDYRRL